MIPILFLNFQKVFGNEKNINEKLKNSKTKNWIEELREEISTPLEQEAPHPEPTSQKELDEECEACAI